MEDLVTRSVVRARYFAIFSALFLLGCQSTSEENIDPNCQTQTTDNCSEEVGMGDDRGYDPCLVNKKLPVCKK